MTDAVVGVLVENLFNSIKAEANIIHEFQSQFDKMVKSLDVMKCFLIDVPELRKHNNNKLETVKKSLNTLRELIYEADDILLDCQIRVDYGTGMMPCTLSPRELLFRYQTGRRLKDINMQINDMEKKINTYCVPLMGREISREITNPRWTTHKSNQSEIVGLTKNTITIKRWIFENNEELQRVGIVGMGGLGKTTIAQKIFNDKEVIDYFNERIWVSVSQPVDVVKMMKSMLEQLHLNDNGTNSTEGTLWEKVQQALTDKTYLIVMDDVWNIESDWWTRFNDGLPKDESHSCSIIITTRNEEVANNMGAKEGRIHRLEPLNEKDSWLLLCKAAFLTTKGKCHHELEDVGKQIVKKCSGLPLAIKAIGGLLSAKTQSKAEWEKININFSGINNINESVIASLQLSYDALPARLKQCILCFCIYPEDSHISAEQLVRWWVGEGFVQGNDIKTATQKAFDSLSELFNRCLVEVVDHRGYDGKVYNCKMHDMVRELIIKMAKEEAFCSFDGGNRQCFDLNSRHLGFTSEIMNKQPLQSNSKLRSLLLTSSCPFSLSPKTGLAQVKSLRVLDLSQNKLDGVCIEALFGWIRSQKRLAYLNLRGVAALKELPNWIKKLRNLQLLILTECINLKTLSPYITTLKKLIVLDIGNCPSLQYLPQGLRELTNLEELSGFKLASLEVTDGCRLVDLKSLKKLRVLRMSIREVDVIEKQELEVLSDLPLQVLSIDAKDCEKEEILMQLDKLSPPQSLQELYLRNYSRDVPPNWLKPSSLQELRYLCLENGKLKGMFGGSKQEQKWQIEGLCLKYLQTLEVEWNTVKQMMPSIKYVEVSHCHMLKSFPCEVNYFGFWRNIEDQDETTME